MLVTNTLESVSSLFSPLKIYCCCHIPNPNGDDLTCQFSPILAFKLQFTKNDDILFDILNL